MRGLEVHESHGHLESCCFGLWDMSDSACNTGKCLIAKQCEEITKKKIAVQEDSRIVDEVVLTKEERKLPEISPMEYMLDLLKGRYDYSTKENDKAVAHYFNKDDRTILTIIVSKTNGKLKLQSVLGGKVLNGINSIEEVEEILREMLG